jgi:pilus assembly protein Flp/PilA
MRSLFEQDGFMRKIAMIQQARRFLANESGATAIEYALIASGVAGAIVVTITALGGSVAKMWTSVRTALG